MAAITTQDQVEARQYCAQQAPVTWQKPQINAALAAIDNWFDMPATRSAISAAIDTAVAPFNFTNTEKKLLLRAWCRAKFNVGT